MKLRQREKSSLRRPGLQCPAPPAYRLGLPASSKLTTYGSWAARFLCQLCQCRTSGVHCSLSSKARYNLCQHRRPFPKQPSTTALSLPSFQLCTPCAVLPRKGPRRAEENAPMSSEKPPTGRRQVPVTNCSSRILFSLSISLTTCSPQDRQMSSASTLDPSTDLSRPT